MDKLVNIVNECLEEHVGGETFFENLDEKVKDREIVHRLLNLIDCTCENIILTGKFGRYLIDNFKHNFSNKYVICVRGDLRSDRDLNLDHVYLYDKEFVLVDDSYYSGKTVKAVESALKSNGASLSKVFVVYDGSKPENSLFEVKSLYSYYGKNNINNICKGCKPCLFQDICEKEKQEACSLFENTPFAKLTKIDIKFKFNLKKLLIETPVEKLRHEMYMLNKQDNKLMKKERRMKVFKFV